MTSIAANPRAPVPLPETATMTPVQSNDLMSPHADRFSHMLSQRQNDGADRIATHKPATRVKNESATKKETAPHDTLQLVNDSHAIQPTVATPPQSVAPPRAPITTIDDVLSKPAATQNTPAVDANRPLRPPLQNPSMTAIPASVADPAATETPPNPAPVSDGIATTAPVTTSVDTNLASASPAQTDAPTADAMPAAVATSTPDAATAATNPADPKIATPATMNPMAEAAADSATLPHANDAPTVKAASPRSPSHSSTQTSAMPIQSIPATAQPVAPEPIVTPSFVPTQASDELSMSSRAAILQNSQANELPTVVNDLATTTAPLAAAIVAATPLRRAETKDDTSSDDITAVDSSESIVASPLSIAEHRDFGALDGKIPAPSPGSTEFADALGERLSWMAERHIGHAEIHLTPDGMGPLDVRVHMDGNRVRAEFGSSNADVRQAISEHLPRLRDMLSQHGFSLSDAHVGGGGQHQQPSARPSIDASTIAPIDDEVRLPAPARIASVHAGVLDEFA